MTVSRIHSGLVIRKKETYCIQNSTKRLLSIKRKAAYLGFRVLQLLPTTVQMFFKCRSSEAQGVKPPKYHTLKPQDTK